MAVQADYFISAVRYNVDHKRIEKLKVHTFIDDQGETWSIEEVIKKIENEDKTAFTIIEDPKGTWKTGSKIHVVKRSGIKYLRANPNQLMKDNLGDLPEFEDFDVSA
jgi:hypothetical protein